MGEPISNWPYDKLNAVQPLSLEFTSLMFRQISNPSEVHPAAHSHEKLPIVSTQTWVSYKDDYPTIPKCLMPSMTCHTISYYVMTY